MNAKTVLNKIMTLLSKDEEKMATAKLADGTIVESPSFDVGQPVEVVTEEGKVPAPDGEHELLVADEEGNEALVKIKTEGGIITEREEEAVGVMEPAVEEMVEELPKEEEEDPLVKMAIRIEELEKRIDQLEGVEVDEERIEEAPDAEVVEVEDEEDFKLGKLDGAPVEKMSRLNVNKAVKTPQSIFLSKLYNK